MPGYSLRQAALPDMQAVARLHRHVRRICLPYLPDLHTPEKDLAYFQGVVFPGSTICLAEVSSQLIGFAAAKDEWLDHLYIDPAWHGRGVGSTLLLAVQEGRPAWISGRSAERRGAPVLRGARVQARRDDGWFG